MMVCAQEDKGRAWDQKFTWNESSREQYLVEK